MRKYLPLGSGIIALCVYATTVCRSIWIGDGGEFALALKSWGICHPPGYPLFAIVGSIWVHALPFLRPIMAANLYNVVIASASVVVVALILGRGMNALLAAVLGVAWAVTPTFWSETAGVEVYCSNLLLMALTFLALESRAKWKWPLTIFVFGLAMAGHPSALSLVPALLYQFVIEKEYRRLNRYPIYIALTILATTIYLYLMIRSAHDPISDWGHPASLSALWQHMNLKQYSGWVAYSWANLWYTLGLYWMTLLESWWWVGVLGVGAGIIIGFRENKKFTISALLILVTSLVLASFHQAVDFEPFFLPPMFASFLLVSNCFKWLDVKKGMRLAATGAAAVVAVLLLVFHYSEHNKSNYDIYESYSKLLLDSTGKGILFTAGDINSFGALYLRYAENYQPEVEVYDRSIRKNALLEKASELYHRPVTDYFEARALVQQFAGEQIFYAKNHYINEPDWLPSRDSIVSFGILYCAKKPSGSPPEITSYPANYDPDDLMSREMIANLDLSRGEVALLNSPPDSSAARREFALAIERMSPEPRGALLANIGAYFRRIGFGDLAIEAYQLAAKKPILDNFQRDEIEFNMSNVYKDRGNEALKHGDFAEAAAQFKEALARDPKNERLLLNIGLIYAQHLHENAPALEYLKKYLALKPDDRQVQALVNNLH